MPAAVVQQHGLHQAHNRRLLLYTIVLIVVWTMLILSSFARYYYEHQQEIINIGLGEARAALDRDMLYRAWATRHGGVYVPVTPQSPPNPYLSHVEERDIITPSGKLLTLINPAYMVRQLYEQASEHQVAGRGHITSLNPLRPENRPDPWEERALQSFENGINETSAQQVMGGQRFIRLMRPFTAEQPCLKCHAHQGYKLGDIRGGISVSIPLAPLYETHRQHVVEEGAIHAMIWLFGVAIVAIGSRKLDHSAGALQESEERYRTVADFTSDWEYWIAPDRSLRYISPSCTAVSGYGQDEFYENPGLMTSIIHPEDLHIYDSHSHAVSENGHPLPIDFRIITKDGQSRWISHICRTVYSADGQNLGQRASNRDITGRKRAEEEIRQQARVLEQEAAERRMAQDELAHKQQQLESLNQSLETRISETVSELRRKDETLIQQGRLAAMGEMINNISHQWRQPLNNLGLLLQNMEQAEKAGELTPEEFGSDIREAMGIIMFMSQTIDDFRDFFRHDRHRSRILVNKQVSATLEFVAATLKSKRIRWTVAGGEDLAFEGYPNEFSQVLLNILTNARDVLLERRIEEPQIDIRAFAENGRVVVTVTDNAGGIPPEVLPKVFDPYFTTKGPNKGTGIGLYMSKVIIEMHMNGSLTARNTEMGAELRIEMPLLQQYP